MTRRERLERTLRGLPVDRPPVCFYEIDGNQNLEDSDPFNIFNASDWRLVVELAREKSDRIVHAHVPIVSPPVNPLSDLTTVEKWTDNLGRRFVKTAIKAGNRTLTHRSRRDPGINTVWTEEHFLKDVDDLKAYLDLPEPAFGGRPDPGPALALEKSIGDSGIIKIDTATPLCLAADLFDMGTYTVIALTEQELFTRLLERFQRVLQPRVEAIAASIPGEPPDFSI